MMNKYQAGRRWFSRLVRGRHEPERLSIGPPTNFRREDLTLGHDDEGNAMLIKQAHEDALNMRKASRLQSFHTHARKISAKFSTKNADAEELLHQQQASITHPHLAELE